MALLDPVRPDPEREWLAAAGGRGPDGLSRRDERAMMTEEKRRFRAVPAGGERSMRDGDCKKLAPAGTRRLWIDGAAYDRVICKTPWLSADDDLLEVVRTATSQLIRAGDTIVISEKIATLLTGHSVDASHIAPTRLARLLVRWVKPIGNSRGISVPEKMQYVIDQQGRTRVIMAACAAAFTRPFGRRGDFYRVAGTLARDLDGMRPPYKNVLLPPLSGPAATALVRELEAALGCAVAVVDINDRGGSIRATSPSSLDAATLLDVLADNPLGQRDQATPIGVIRPLGRG